VIKKFGLSDIEAALRWARDDSFNEKLREFVEAARMDVFDGAGKTMLMVAAGNDAVANLDYLLGAGFDPDAEDSMGRRALSHAAAMGSARCLAKLLSFGADVDAVDSAGRTALIYATLDTHGPCVSLLLEHGARVDVVDSRGQPAYIYAMRAGKSGAECLAMIAAASQRGALDAHVSDAQGSQSPSKRI
jgi:ankyrin repeat protein